MPDLSLNSPNLTAAMSWSWRIIDSIVSDTIFSFLALRVATEY